MIGEFLLDEKGRIENYSMQEIAEKTFSSKSSLVRFAKQMGFSGWKEFQQEFLAEIHYEDSHYTDIDPNYPFDENSTLKDITYQISSLMVESILDTADQLDQEELKKSVDILTSARRIAVFGVAPNSILAQSFRRKMLSVGKNIEISENDQGYLARSMSSEDAAIIISYTGNLPERIPLRYISTLKEKNVRIIGITGLGENYLREKADCVLSMSSRERIYSKIATYSTEESITFILNLLYSGYFARNYRRNLVYKISSSEALENRHASREDLNEIEEY